VQTTGVRTSNPTFWGSVSVPSWRAPRCIRPVSPLNPMPQQQCNGMYYWHLCWQNTTTTEPHTECEVWGPHSGEYVYFFSWGGELFYLARPNSIQS
jgi:hypothetical protein